MSTSRRSFLKTGAILSGSALFNNVRAAEEPKIRVAIIGRTGKGDYGHAVDMAFTKLPNVEIVALADESEPGRAAAAKRLNPKQSYADYHEMLAKEKVDVVAICPRWVDQHRDMIVTAARAGCHVYMEKPFCPTLADCDLAVDELKKKKLKLGIAHISQYSPVLDVVKSIIEHGEIGDVLEIRSRGKEDKRGGGEDLWVLGSHLFGIMRSIAGNPTSCFATMLQNGQPVTKANVAPGAEGLGPLAGDHVTAMFQFGKGITGHFASKKSAAGSPSRFALQIHGSKGIIEMESGYLAKAYILKDSSWSPGRTGKPWAPITSAGIGKPETRTDGTYEGGHIAAIKDLFDAMKNDRPTKCSAEDSRDIVQMIMSVFESHRAGGPIKVPLTNRENPLAMLK